MTNNYPYRKPEYYLNDSGAFVIKEYNLAKPFASFFPGISGKYGIPMWVFYVNRGQAIASFGTRDKDHAIMEFFPANKSWQLTPSFGFRTFIKSREAGKTLFYEPFHNGFVNLRFKLTNRMLITAYGLSIEEENFSLGLKINVEYFTIPEDAYAGLARVVTITNTCIRNRKIQLLDGMPQVVPFGINNFFLKELGRTLEAWITVENLKKGVPFFKLSVDPQDRPQVLHIEEGNFYLGLEPAGKGLKILKPAIDPEQIFGECTDFSCPLSFIAKNDFIIPEQKEIRGKSACAFSFLNYNLKPGEKRQFYSIIGNMRSLEMLNSSLSKITRRQYLAVKKGQNRSIIKNLQSGIETRSSSSNFDLYAKQTYLDNILRGGYPEIFSDGKRETPLYLYTRKHGDLERDYNKYLLQPSYLSQGNANYRDLNQNRRCDIWFNPQIKEENLITFLNLIQTDGFNPLVIKGCYFTFEEGKKAEEITGCLSAGKDAAKILAFLKKPFTPGELIFFIEENRIKLNSSYDGFLGKVLPACVKHQDAEHGEGFWTDHWHYNLDLLENYLLVYPEKLKETIFEKRIFTFFDNSEIVKPRSEKYVLYEGKVRQFKSLAADSAKKALLKKRETLPHCLRADHGRGQIYKTTLIVKLFCLLANKLASLDPFGCGIEMEADKPNWFDSLNGLPGLLGSSSCETFELKRLALFIKKAVGQSGSKKIALPEEIADFLFGLDGLVKEYFRSSDRQKDFSFWNKSACLKEKYRHRTKLGFSGKEVEADTEKLNDILDNAVKKCESGLKKAFDGKKKVYYGYFINEVIDYEILKENLVRPKKFRQIRLPLFLEGQVHALRLAGNLKEALEILKGTKKSLLFDKELKMYKVTAPLKEMPEEIGRCRIFTPGWLENESVWLHMEYKYLLEFLKQGLYREFYADFKNVLIPFQPPDRYGRSILENSSFIVSSAHPDKGLHGNGFVARLSGSTAEFLNIWLMMNLGKEPFFLNKKNELNLRFAPVLAEWLFDDKGLYSFNFLSKIRITYHNPKKKDTFSETGVKAKRIAFRDNTGKNVEINSDTIPAPYASQIRSCLIKQIDIFLA